MVFFPRSRIMSAFSGGPLDRVRQELDRWLETARTTSELALDAVGLTSDTRPITPAIDVLETETDLHIFADLPGVGVDGVDLALQGQVLLIKAHRSAPAVMTEATKPLVRERWALAFERSVTLPIAIDAESVRAVVRDGLLHVTLRKRPEIQARPIPVQRGNDSTPVDASPTPPIS
jgi:HSP20 family protein